MERRKWQAVRSVSIASEMNPTMRQTMEDAMVIEDTFAGSSGQGLFAVLDGHGGRGVVEFVQQHLARAVARELRSNDEASTEKRIRRAFMNVDMESRHIETSGTTAAVCFLRCDASSSADVSTRTLCAANVGDARAVLCQDGKAVRVTKDHKATDADEKRRIERLGGFVLRGRVCGLLAVGRAFGDHALKQFVPAHPYYSETKLGNRERHPFFIVACDGVWDVMSDQDAVDIVLQAKSASQRAQAAQMLVDEAMERNSTDNITAMVVFL